MEAKKLKKLNYVEHAKQPANVGGHSTHFIMREMEQDFFTFLKYKQIPENSEKCK